jgi:hypothetical protein
MKNEKNRGVGRPSYAVKYPNHKFTMSDLMVANGVNPKTGKGKLCTKLTLVKALQRDMFILDKNGKPDVERPRRNSTIVRVKNETRQPNSVSGLGRKTFVYIRRDKLVKSEKTVTVSIGTKPESKSYEETKAELLGTTPAVEITAPVASEPTSEIDAAQSAPEEVTHVTA